MELADAIVARYRPLVLLGGTAGLRMGELAGLTWDRVDLFTGHVRVVEQLRMVNGKPELALVKTKAGRRQVRVPRFVADALKKYKTIYEPGPGGTVFASGHGLLLRHNNFRRHHFIPASKKAGLEGITPHVLRHSAVSLWIAGGANPKQVQMWAGHSSIQVTFDLYGHLFPDNDKRTVEGLDSAFQDLSAKDATIIRLPRRH